MTASVASIPRYDVMPDWSASSNPHLMVVGPQARRIGSLLFSNNLKNWPSIVIGDLSRSIMRDEKLLELSAVNLLDGCISAHAMPLFDDLVRGMSGSAVSLTTLVRNRRKPGVQNARQRVACRPRVDLTVELRGISVQALMEHAARLGYAAPEFSVDGRSVSWMTLRNDPRLLRGHWRAIVSWENRSDSQAYEADGICPDLTEQAIENEIEARLLELVMSQDGGVQGLNRSQLNELARAQVGDRLWALAAIGAGSKEMGVEEHTLRNAVEALRSASSQGDHSERVLADQLEEMLGGTVPLDLRFAQDSPILIDVSGASPLRFAVLLGTVFSIATMRQDTGLPKFIVLDLSDQEMARRLSVASAIECLLRQGRKFNCWCVILSETMDSVRYADESIDPERLCGSVMVDVTIAGHGLGEASSLPEDWRKPGIYWWRDATMVDPVIVCPERHFTVNPSARFSVPWSRPN